MSGGFTFKPDVNCQNTDTGIPVWCTIHKLQNAGENPTRINDKKVTDVSWLFITMG
jgi:hypothetical protein